MNQVGKLLPLVCVGFVALAMGYLLASKMSKTTTMTTTDGWLTNEDKTNGFTVNFPPGTGELASDPDLGHVLPAAVGGKERWLAISVLNATDKNLNQDKCFVVNDFQITDNRFFNGRRFCQSTTVEGAAGSAYRTDVYVTRVGEKYVTLKFTTRYTNDVHVYGDCETDWDLAKPLCQGYAFDPVRDLKLYDDIATTLKTN